MGSYGERFRLIKLGLLPKEAVAKPKKPLKKVSDKKKAEMAEERKNKDGDTDLRKWYADIMAKEERKCWETGEKIKFYKWEYLKNGDRVQVEDIMGWHGSIAHILPKADFPSVATHPQNYMILKMWGGTHGQYDSSWENASKMKIWPYAIKIINILYPLLTPEEKARIRGIEVIAQEIRPEVYNSK